MLEIRKRNNENWKLRLDFRLGRKAAVIFRREYNENEREKK